MDEDDSVTATASSFTHRETSKKWLPEETIKFYRVSVAVATSGLSEVDLVKHLILIDLAAAVKRFLYLLVELLDRRQIFCFLNVDI